MVVGLGLGVSDIDGNAYGSVLIGSQEWMQQNLKVSKFRNGDLISTNLDSIAWSNDTSGAYAVYDGNSTNDTIYGKLYNWYAVSDARGLCPVGWHVPSRNEWDILNNFLDTAFVPSNNISYSAGGKLKAAGDFQSGTGYWNQPNVGASDEIGFSALGGGQRSENNIYKFKNEIGQWWSSTPFPSLNPPLPWFVEMSKDNRFVANDVANATFGFSVRCLKD
jgi:uncharacterized protein (TIGR02145 family)